MGFSLNFCGYKLKFVWFWFALIVSDNKGYWWKHE